MKNLIALIFSCAFLAACGGGGGGPASELPACTVQLDGDSALDTPGIARRPGDYLRAARPHWTVEDRSVQGTTLAALMEGRPARWVEKLGRYEDAVMMPYATLTRTARVVVVENGAVDGLHPVEDGRYEARIRSVIALLRGEGREVVLTGIVPLPVGEWFTAERLEALKVSDAASLLVAAELGLEHAGWGQMPFAGVVETSDGIHRAQESSDVKLAAPLLAAVDRACAKAGMR